MPLFRTIFKAFATLAGVSVLMAGCASGLQSGMSREQVLSSYGTPTRTVPLASGSRLQYSTQPTGRTAVMVDLDAAGKVVKVQQVLNPQDFSRVQAGAWTREDMEREFGPPATMDRVYSWPGEIMTYRWQAADQPMFFWAYLDARNVVQRTGQGMEFPIKINDN